MLRSTGTIYLTKI